jgi:predicted metal-dependent phosphotriesterase family hydrolase
MAGGTLTRSTKASNILNVPAGSIVATDVQAALNELDIDIGALQHLGINPQPNSYALLLTDDGVMVDLDNAAPMILTVPKDATTNFLVGTSILFRQKGAGQVTITPEDGTVIINSQAGLKTIGQHSVASLLKVAANLWVAFGSLTI